MQIDGMQMMPAGAQMLRRRYMQVLHLYAPSEAPFPYINQIFVSQHADGRHADDARGRPDDPAALQAGPARLYSLGATLS